ncbi:AfsR/SARP family transcriptional regulator [Lentzea sp. NPDC004789]
MIEFRLLGPVELRSGDEQLDLGAAKQRCVLAVLLIAGRSGATVDALIERVWGDELPDQVRASLYSYLARLRAILRKADPSGATSVRRRPGGGYWLDRPCAVVDMDELADLVSAAGRCDDPAERARLLDSAVELRRGVPLEGLSGLWAEQVREHLDRQHLAALSDWADAVSTARSSAEVVERLSAGLITHPLAEPLAERLLVALHATGRTGEASHWYERFCARLDAELGAKPSARLREVHERLQGSRSGRGAPARSAGPPIPAQLPPVVGTFTGRADYLRELDRLLGRNTGTAARGSPFLAAISGMPGVGKSALTIRWAHHVADRFPDGQLFASLDGHGPGRPRAPVEVLAGFLRALGVPAHQIPEDEPSAAALYRSLLAGRRILVLLDNAVDAAQVRPLLPGATRAAALVTSRAALTGLTATHGCTLVRLRPMSAAEATALVSAMLGEHQAKQEHQAMQRLVAYCAGLPLALRIAAASIVADPDEGVARYVARLDEPEALANLAVPGDDEVAVRVAFDRSYEALDDAVRRAFRRLGLFAGRSIGLAAAAALCGTGVDATERLLRRLVEAQLVERLPKERFALHDLLHRYAAERAAREDTETERGASLARLYGWYRGTADAVARIAYPVIVRLALPEPPADAPAPLTFATPAAALDWTDEEWPNLVALVSRASSDGLPDQAWFLADAMRGYLIRRKYLHDWATVASAALAAAESCGDQRAAVAAHASLGVLASVRSDGQAATRSYRRMLEGARATGWRDAEAGALGNLGLTLHHRGRLHEAAARHREGLQLAIELREPTRESGSRHNLGRVLRELGQPKQALREHLATLRLHRATGVEGYADLLLNLGLDHWQFGGYRRAEYWLSLALTEFRALGDQASVVVASGRLAQLLGETGRIAEATGLADQAMDLAARSDIEDSKVVAVQARADCHRYRGEPDAARHAYREAAQLARQMNYPLGELEATAGLAFLDGAPDGFRAALPKAAERRIWECRLRLGLAAALLSQADVAAAEAEVWTAELLAEETGHLPGTARAHIISAAIAQRQGRHQLAHEHQHAAQALYAAMAITPNAPSTSW